MPGRRQAGAGAGKLKENPRMLVTRPLRLSISLSAALAITACTHVVPVTGTIPTPVVQSLPLSVGIYMDEEFRSFSHAEKRGAGEEWIIGSGKLNEEMFTRLFNSMFDQTVIMNALPEAGAGTEGLDAVLQIKVTEFGFLTPRETGQRFFAVSFKYLLQLQEPDGTQIANWPVVGYGKSPWSAFKDETGLRNATAIAIRDGAAAVALGFRRVPAIASWLESKGINEQGELTETVE